MERMNADKEEEFIPRNNGHRMKSGLKEEGLFGGLEFL